MDVRDYFDFIDETSIRLKGHRIYIDEILNEHFSGKAPEEILHCFPQLPLEKIYATLLFYEVHKVEVETYLERVQQQKTQLDQEWRQTQTPTLALLEERERRRKAREKRISEGTFDPLWDEPA